MEKADNNPKDDQDDIKLLPKESICWGVKRWLNNGSLVGKQSQLCHGITMISVKVKSIGIEFGESSS